MSTNAFPVFAYHFRGKKLLGTYARTLVGSSLTLDYLLGTFADQAWLLRLWIEGVANDLPFFPKCLTLLSF